MVKRLVEALRIYSPPGKEEQIANYLYKLMSNMTFHEVYIDDVGNVHAIHGKGPTLLLAGHMDTVPGYIPVRVSGDIIYGRGAVDAKGPLLAMIFGVDKAINSEVNIPFKIHIAALVDEEGESKGAKYLIENNVKFDYAIICEPTNTIGVVVECRGSAHYKLECKGLGGHASSPQVGDSALEKILTVLLRIRELTNGNKGVTITPTAIESKSDAINKLPEYAYAILDVRYSTGISFNELSEILDRIARELGCNVQLLSEPTPPLKVKVTNPVVRAIVRGILRLGKKPLLMKKTGTNDANLLQIICKNIVVYGPGDSKLAHSNTEAISIKDFITGIDVYYYSILELSKITNI